MTRIQDDYILFAAQMASSGGGALRGATGDTGPAGPAGPAGTSAPLTIDSTSTYTVATNTQVLIAQPIAVSGVLVINGLLVQVRP